MTNESETDSWLENKSVIPGGEFNCSIPINCLRHTPPIHVNDRVPVLDHPDMKSVARDQWTHLYCCDHPYFEVCLPADVSKPFRQRVLSAAPSSKDRSSCLATKPLHCQRVSPDVIPMYGSVLPQQLFKDVLDSPSDKSIKGLDRDASFIKSHTVRGAMIDIVPIAEQQGIPFRLMGYGQRAT